MKPSPAIAIRHAKAKDYEALFHLFTIPEIAHSMIGFPQALVDHPLPWSTRHDEECYFLIALAGCQIVGGAELRIYTSLRQRHAAQIHAIGVFPNWQRQGIGNQLMNAVIELADRMLTLHRLDLLVFTDNDRAIGLFEKFGFGVEGTLRHLIRRSNQYTDVYSMSRLSSI